MTHRVTVASNPRMLLLAPVLLALPASGVLLLVYAGTLVGILALAGSAYLDYTMIRFLYRNLRSRVVTSDAQISCRLPGGEDLVFPWRAITAAGYCTQPRGRSFLFVYDQKMDKIVTIPDEYSLFGELKSELRRRVPPAIFQELSLEAGQTIQERLRPLIRPGEG
jgi:hypothetical protein